MLLLLVAYLGGVLTIVSPCILPVLPFVFARADRSFWRSALPMLAGMAVTFAGVATLAAVGGGWAVQANQWGAGRRLSLLALFGLTLLFPTSPTGRCSPWCAWRAPVAGRRGRERDGIGGVAPARRRHRPAVGAVRRADPRPDPDRRRAERRQCRNTLLLLAYALGAATSLALALLIGGRVFKAMKRSLGAGQWVRRRARVAVLSASARSRSGWTRAISPAFRAPAPTARAVAAGRFGHRRGGLGQSSARTAGPPDDSNPAS